MYSSLAHLSSAIRTSLNRAAVCRIYKDTLDACWPNLSDQAQADRVEKFAGQYHWTVSFRQIGSLGLVAEFQKADVAAEA